MQVGSGLGNFRQNRVGSVRVESGPFLDVILVWQCRSFKINHPIRPIRGKCNLLLNYNRFVSGLEEELELQNKVLIRLSQSDIDAQKQHGDNLE